MQQWIMDISAMEETMVAKAKQRQRRLAKPYGSLGRLETLSAQIAGITHSLSPSLLRRAVVVFAADNGVWAEGITPIGQQTTALQCKNMLDGRAGVAVIAKQAKADVLVVDVGTVYEIEHSDVFQRKIKQGTNNIAQGPAMTKEECNQAFQVGAEMADYCYEQGDRMVGVGEMGVGNTTTTTAIASVLLNKDPALLAGKGAGLEDDAYQNKIETIRRAIQINQPDANDPLDVIQKVGGFDIAAMVGFILRSVYHHQVVVIDGYISLCAGLLALRLQPKLKGQYILSHHSAEPAYQAILEAFGEGEQPLFDFGLRLGEGSGCPLAFQVIDQAMAVLNQMATFEEANINAKQVADNWHEEI